MRPAICVVAVLFGATATAAPVPKEKPDPLPDGAVLRLGANRYRGANTDGVAFSADGKTLVAADKGTVLRWAAGTGKPLDPIKLDVTTEHNTRVFGDRLFVPARANSTPRFRTAVRVVSATTGQEVSRLDVNPTVDFTSVPHRLSAFAVSADGRRAAAAHHEKPEAVVYDVDDGKVIRTFALKEKASAVQLSPDGKTLFAPGQDRVYRFDVDAETDLPALDEVTGVSLLEVSADGKTAVTSGYAQKGVGGRAAGWQTAVWDLGTGKRRFDWPNVAPWHLRFAGNDALIGGHAVAGGTGMGLCRWNLTTGKRDWVTPLGFAVGQSNLPSGWLAVSPDGKRVAVSNRDQLMAVYDADTGKRIDDNPAHGEPVRWLSFSADGKTIQTASDRDLRTWDAATGELKSAVAPDEVRAARFVGAAGDVLVWHEVGGKDRKAELLGWDRAKSKLAWRMAPELAYMSRVTAAGTRIAAVAGTKSAAGPDAVVVFDATGAKKHEWKLPANVAILILPGLSADEVFLAGQFTKPGAGSLEVVGLALADGAEKRRFEMPADRTVIGPVYAITPAPDGKSVFLGDIGGKLLRVDAKTGAVTKSVIAGTGVVETLAFSPDGKRLLVQVTDDPVVRLIDLDANAKPRELTGDAGAASAVAFSPDGKRAAVGYRDATTLIWTVAK